ncbi:MAG: PH domain-containing protein [Candidatus Kerfeldbacteria bacterium]|nr:PH domain-containing protein [Candidatus Kerfeldbacteria bacterium]
MYHPTSFPGQQPDEKIVTVLHRHWFVFATQLARIVLMAVLPLIVLGVIVSWTNFRFESGTLSYTLLVMGGSLYFLFLVNLLYGFWLDYALDVFIVSDKRVVDIEQAGMFNRTVAEQRLYRVQDVTFEVKGLVRTFFHFGDVYVQSAGERQRFVFEDVPHPDRVAELLLRQMDQIRKAGEQDLTDPDAIMRGREPIPHHQHPPTGGASA